MKVVTAIKKVPRTPSESGASLKKKKEKKKLCLVPNEASEDKFKKIKLD